MSDIMTIAEANGLGSQFWPALADAESPQDLVAIATQLKLRQDREFEIASSMDGVDGFVARASVNMLDPAFLLAGGGVGFVAKQTKISLVAASALGTSRAGKVAAGGLQAAGENIIADAPLELYRKSQDPTYTWDQYALAVGGSATFGVILGGLGGAVSPRQAESFEKTLHEAIYTMGQEGHGDAGARQLNEVLRYTDDDYLDIDASAPDRQKFSFGTPLARLQRSENTTVRGLAALLSWNPTAKGKAQGTTAWEAKRRIVDSAAAHARPAVEAAKQFYAAKGDLAVTGGMSTRQMDEFFTMVGHHAEMVRTGQTAHFNTDPNVVAAFKALDAGTSDTLNYVRGRGYVTGRDAPPPPPKPTDKPKAPKDPAQGPAETVESIPEAVIPDVPTAPEVAPAAPDSPAFKWQVVDSTGTVHGTFDDVKEGRKLLIDKSYGRKGEGPTYRMSRIADDAAAPEAPKKSYLGRKSFRTESKPKVAKSPRIIRLEQLTQELHNKGYDGEDLAARVYASVDSELAKTLRDKPEEWAALLPKKAEIDAAIVGVTPRPAKAQNDMGVPTSKYSRESGEHSVTYPDGTTAKIYKDQQTKDWNIVEPAGYKSVPASDPAHIQTYLGTTKAEALENLPGKLSEYPADKSASVATDATTSAVVSFYAKQREMYENGEDFRKPITGVRDVVGSAAGSIIGAAGGGLAEELDAAPDGTTEGLAIAGAVLGLLGGRKSRLHAKAKWSHNTPGIGVFVSPTQGSAEFKQAMKMEMKGADRDAIWKATLHGRGPSGDWITEASDPMGWLKETLTDAPTNLKSVLDAPTILAASPDVRETALQVAWLYKHITTTGHAGVTAREAGDRVASIAVDPKLPHKEQLAVLLHELQHGFDDAQGRGSGANPDDLKGFDDPFYAYLTNAAEQSARTAALRIGMSRAERLERGPWHDYDVPEADLWVSNTMAEAASIGSHLQAFRTPEWKAANVTEYADDYGQRTLDIQLPSGNDGITIKFVDVDAMDGKMDGPLEVEWDWQSNRGTMDIRDDKSMAEVQQAAAAVLSTMEETLSAGDGRTYVFSGLKEDTGRMQATLLKRRAPDDYEVASAEVISKTTKNKKGVPETLSYFALVPRGKGSPEDAVQAMLGSKKPDKIERLERANRQPIAASAKDPTAPEADTSPTGRPLMDEDGYDGAHDFKEFEHQEGFMKRSFDKAGFDTLMSRFRDADGVASRLMMPIHRANEARFAEIGARTGVDSYDIAGRVSRTYVRTVSTLMNAASKKDGAKFQPMHPEYRDAAKEIVRQSFNDGDPFPGDLEEAIDMVMDLVAPVKKKTANSNRAKPRIDMQFDPSTDADIMTMFQWNAMDNFMSYRSELSGHAGLLKMGFRSAAELDTAIKGIRDAADKDPRRQKAMGREADMLEAMKDAILGVPSEALMSAPGWSFWTNQLRRMNFASTMGNVGFLAVSEIGGAMTATGPGAIFTRLPQFRKFYELARSGDPAAKENLYYMSDLLMGHASAQLRARLTKTNSRFEEAFESLADPRTEFENKVDTFTRKSSNLTARWSGMHVIQEYLRSNIAVDGANFYHKAALAGKKPHSDRRMMALGIDDAMWTRISGEMRRMNTIESPDTGRPLNAWDVNEWQDEEALNVFINAVDRDTRRVVMEGDLGHLPLEFRSSPTLQLLTQFMNFPISAYSKHLGFATNVGDAKVASEVILMSLGGAIGYMARTSLQAAAVRDEAERAKFVEERLTMEEAWKAAFYYSAHASLVPNAVDTVGALAKDMGAPGAGPIFSKTRASGLGSDILTGNPSYSKVSRFKKGLTDLVKDGPSQDEVKNLGLLMAPLGNHVLTQLTVNALFALVPDTEVFPDHAPEN